MMIQKMMRVWGFMTTVIFLLAGYPAGAKETYKGVDEKGTAGQVSQKQKERINVNKIEGDVAEAVKTILLLWTDGKYEDSASQDVKKGEESARKTGLTAHAG